MAGGEPTPRRGHCSPLWDGLITPYGVSPNADQVESRDVHRTPGAGRSSTVAERHLGGMPHLIMTSSKWDTSGRRLEVERCQPTPFPPSRPGSRLCRLFRRLREAFPVSQCSVPLTRRTTPASMSTEMSGTHCSVTFPDCRPESPGDAQRSACLSHGLDQGRSELHVAPAFFRESQADL